MIARLTEKMTAFYQGDVHDVFHFLKVYSFARTIGLLEGLEPGMQAALETAAVVHDIACPYCREKYGSASGNLQERESEALLRPFLEEFDLEDQQRERVIQLVSRHHTYTDVDGMDCQILLEADYLVNAGEGKQSPEAIRTFRDKVFRTSSGIRLLNSLYRV